MSSAPWTRTSATPLRKVDIAYLGWPVHWLKTSVLLRMLGLYFQGVKLQLLRLSAMLLVQGPQITPLV
jgi:hypothetical protein